MNDIEPIVLKDLSNPNSTANYPYLVEVYNPDIVWGDTAYGQDDGYLRLISSDISVQYKGKTWLPANFDYTQPETDGSKVGQTTISISAIDSRVKRLLRTIRDGCEIKVIASFVKKEKDNRNGYIYKFFEINSKRFSMTVASSNSMSATFNLEFDPDMQQNVPYTVATPDITPAIKD